MSRVIAIANQKGGVGKTTTAINLGASLAVAERKVLIIDIDPQGNATSGLGLKRAEIDTSIYDVLIDGAKISDVLVREVHFPYLDVAPSSRDLVGAEVELVGRPQRELVLRGALEGIREEYDFVLIDCPPSLGLLTVNGLFAADEALVVTAPSAWASDGVEQVLTTIERVGRRKPNGLQVTGIVVNNLGRTRDASYWHAQIESDHGDLTLPPIRQRAAITEAGAQSLPVHSLGNRPGAREAADEFAELLRAITGQRVASATPVSE